jgi:hypothetical protein
MASATYPPPVAGSTCAHAPPIYSYPSPPTYPYPPPQPIHSWRGEHSAGGENTSQKIQAPARSKTRNEWTCEDEENLVGLNFILSLLFFWLLCYTYKVILHIHAWLMHFVDCVESNAKPRVKFWGVIVDTYNTIIDTHCQQTPKNLKDHWPTYNKQVSLFNKIYNQ